MSFLSLCFCRRHLDFYFLLLTFGTRTKLVSKTETGLVRFDPLMRFITDLLLSDCLFHCTQIWISMWIIILHYSASKWSFHTVKWVENDSLPHDFSAWQNFIPKRISISMWSKTILFFPLDINLMSTKPCEKVEVT